MGRSNKKMNESKKSKKNLMFINKQENEVR